MAPRALVLLLVLALLWSTGFTLTKVAVDTVPPITVVAVRVVLASIILWPYLRLSGRSLPGRDGQWGLYVLLALTGNVLPFFVIGWAQMRVDSGLAAILIGTMPLITLALAAIFARDEPINPTRIAGFMLGFLGVLMLFGPRSLAGLESDLAAQLALIVGATLFAINMLLTRRLTGDITAAAAAVSVASAVIAVPLSLAIDRPWQLAPSSQSVMAIVTLGVFASAIATIVFFQLVRLAGATATAMVNYLIPGLGVLWGVLFLGERPGWPELAALALIVCALMLVNRGKAR